MKQPKVRIPLYSSCDSTIVPAETKFCHWILAGIKCHWIPATVTVDSYRHIVIILLASESCCHTVHRSMCAVATICASWNAADDRKFQRMTAFENVFACIFLYLKLFLQCAYFVITEAFLAIRVPENSYLTKKKGQACNGYIQQTGEGTTDVNILTNSVAGENCMRATFQNNSDHLQQSR